MREKAKRGETTFAMTADVKEAHRRIPVAREDWRLLGWRVRPGTYVSENTLEAFGIRQPRTIGRGSDRGLAD